MAAGCTESPAPGGDESGRDAGPEVRVDEQEPRHLLIRVPPRHMDRFPEGAGLLRSVPAHRMGGEASWWVAYLSLSRVQHLADSLDGVEWQLDRAQELLHPDDELRTFDHAGGQGDPPCDTQPRTGDFCPYDSTSARCSQSLLSELNSIPANYPPEVELLDLGTTGYLGLPIKAVRIGNSTSTESQPQLVFYAGQHAREWVTVEVAMELIRYFADSYRDKKNGVDTLLQGKALVIVPVANPDGYELSFSNNRDWRTNAYQCANGNTGVDPNRNFGFGWGEPGADHMCFDNQDTYRGPSAESEPESAALQKVLANNGLSGSWVTRLSMNVHAYANALMFPDGFSSGFSPCTTNTNCSPPDLGAFHKLVGTDVSPEIRDVYKNDPYATGPLARVLTSASGDSTAEHHYGHPSTAPNALAFSVEMTNHECGFHTEHMAHSKLDALVDRYKTLVTGMVEELPSLDDRSFFENFQMPHLHRRSPDGMVDGSPVSGLAEYPTVRVSVNRDLSNPEVGLPGPSLQQDDVIAGVGHRMWRWRPDPQGSPYVFPGEIPLCAEDGTVCEDIELGGGGQVDLCDSGRFNVGSGWSFAGNQAGGPQAECFWKFNAVGGGTGSWELTSDKWDLSRFKDTRLVYSMRKSSSVRAEVVVSDNGFSNCSTSGFGSCRIVRTYPRSEARNSLSRLNKGLYRTQIVDLSDFDGSTKVKVRFRTKESPNSSDEFHLYDPLVIGWEK